MCVSQSGQGVFVEGASRSITCGHSGHLQCLTANCWISIFSFLSLRNTEAVWLIRRLNPTAARAPRQGVYLKIYMGYRKASGTSTVSNISCAAWGACPHLDLRLYLTRTSVSTAENGGGGRSRCKSQSWFGTH
ncbi:hypothetical protein RRG08_015585 [Elysia crispata]|uniref:Uncharacterized protein n=1 Tax=Elysia crispata TaxID=231223 RepID=A0AAE1CZL3_9GAST|nr:hypothetical protein RRG08_015585 [Elysia crispata]